MANEPLEAELSVNIKKLAAGLAAAEARMQATAKRFGDTTTQANKRVSDGLAQSAAGWANLGKVTNAQRFVLQNTSANLGDIAVQLASGTSALRVMGQQIPQVLGGFAALGGTLGLLAPVLGTIAAIGFPVAAALLATGDGGEEAAEKVKTFREALDEASGALGRAEKALADASTGGLDEIKKRYGEVTTEISTLVDTLAKLEIENASRATGEAVGKIFPDLKAGATQLQQAVAEYDALVTEYQEIQNKLFSPASLSQAEFDALDARRKSLESILSGLRPVRDQIEAMADSLNLLPDEAASLAGQLGAAGAAIKAQDFKQAADILAGMRDYAQSLGFTLGDDVLQNIVMAEQVTREMAARFTDSEAAAVGTAAAAAGIAGPVGAAADEAARLTGNLASALSLLASVTAGLYAAQRQAAQRNAVILSTVGDPAGRAAGLAGVDFNEQTGAAAYEMIRSGDFGSLGKLADVGASTTALAAEEAQAEETAKALDKAASARAGGGKGKDNKDILGDYQAQTAALLEQGEAIRAIISAGGDWQSGLAALEQKQRLLNAAQRAGIEITPELEARIQSMAEAYVQASDSVSNMKSAAQTGQTALENLFGSILEGSDAAKKALANLLLEIAKVQFSKGVMQLLGAAGGGGLINLVGGLLTSANGNVVSGPGIGAYSGKVVSKPTVFPFASGIGLMGEAGPEAILPLTRIGGKLGVRAEGSHGAQVTFAIDARGAEAGVEEKIEAAIRRAAPAIVRQATGQAVVTTFRRMQASKAGWS